MRRWIAVFAVFTLTAIVAAYVALFPLAPLGPPAARPALETLDQTAARASALSGRDAAVIAPLATGMVLALLLAVVGRGSGRTALVPMSDVEPSRSRQGRRRKLVHPDPELVWRPEPDPVEPEMDRVPGLLRDEGYEEVADIVGEAIPAESEYPPVPDPEPVAVEPRRAGTVPALSLTPIVLSRRPRERDIDEQTWFDSTSWLGGLPRLGALSWPRDEHGALPFAAQIDLAELAAACPESPLPCSGALAFFLGTGAVIEVPSGDHVFTEPPADLPPAFDEGGYPLPEHVSRLSRPYFPFWPVEPMVAERPAGVLAPVGGDLADEDYEHPVAEELAGDAGETAWLTARVATRESAYTVREPVQRLWWHGVMYLADCLHAAMDGAAREMAMEQERLTHAEARLATLQATPTAARGDLDEARAALAASEAELPALQAERASLARMIAAMDGFIAGRDAWSPLDPDEMDVIEEVLAQVHHDCARLVRFCVPQTLGDLATVSLRAMVTGDDGAFAQVPDEELARINSGHLLAIRHQHQLFGAGVAGSLVHPGQVLLLQLGCDDMIEWNWGDTGLFQFWITPEDLAAARWDRVTLTFAPG
ncbi:uncharacterized protein DUF1963 [Novosphingobium sp. PhB165]|uniref:DUF1963 domain-containing protein n=1 Tax=Novosphingobium sp. PhB165 TaxID=2485105 RepID=UPI001053925F|nr:DUF1963 domain-containing protein [Novosphingobium sp. PhB165]TCM17927.1 uncharacterized protein DUF1963 [Novosphingobium sp. PhB165]